MIWSHSFFTLLLNRNVRCKFANFSTLFQVDTPTLQEKLEAKKALLHVRKPTIDFTPRYRMKGKSGSAQKFKRKQKVREDTQREYLKTAYSQREELNLVKKSEQQSKPTEILDRFKPKKKVKKSWEFEIKTLKIFTSDGTCIETSWRMLWMVIEGIIIISVAKPLFCRISICWKMKQNLLSTPYGKWNGPCYTIW